MVGEFKDDQLQSHTHNLRINYPNNTSGGNSVQGNVNGYGTQSTYLYNTMTASAFNARGGEITRGKRKGVKYIIKVL